MKVNTSWFVMHAAGILNATYKHKYLHATQEVTDLELHLETKLFTKEGKQAKEIHKRMNVHK